MDPFTSQNRVGSKFGGGGVAGASETNVDRRERLRKIAMGVVDLNKVCPKTLPDSRESFLNPPSSRTHS
jgi:splicing factor 3A subunit 2